MFLLLLNYKERYKDIYDYYSYIYNLSRCEIKVWKKVVEVVYINKLWLMIIVFEIYCKCNLVNGKDVLVV